MGSFFDFTISDYIAYYGYSSYEYYSAQSNAYGELVYYETDNDLNDGVNESNFMITTIVNWMVMSFRPTMMMEMMELLTLMPTVNITMPIN